MGNLQGRKQDLTEKWLAENDPDYKQRRRGWQTPSTDALAQKPEIHPTLADLTPIEPRNTGNYFRRRRPVEPEDYSDLDE